MTMPDQRQRDPVAWSRGGEVALVVVAAIALVLSLAALIGLALASAWFGEGWVWPHGTDTIGHVLGGLLTGQPGRGLPAAELARVPGRTRIYACVVGTELLVMTVAIAIALPASRWLRPADARRGMASRWEVRRVLGRRRLCESARLIRPDLHKKRGFVR